MGSVKGKCDSKERRKRVRDNFGRQKRGTFFGKEVLWEMCLKSCQKRDADGRANFWTKRCANNLCQRRCYETPLQDRVPVNSGKVIEGDIWSGRGPRAWGGGGGVRRFLIVGQSSLVNELFATRSADFSYSPDSDRSKSISIFNKVFVFRILSYCYISPGSCKDGKCKGAATPSPFSLHTVPPPRVLHARIMSGWARSFLFFPPFFQTFFMFTKRLWFFGNNVSGTKTERVFSSFKEDG